jgi:hypothetical protein
MPKFLTKARTVGNYLVSKEATTYFGGELILPLKALILASFA